MEVQLVVAGGSKAGQVIPIPGAKFLIGRAEDCHLKPRSELISRYHCAIISEDGYVAIRDLGSKNGVYLNGERVSLENELKSGDKLSLGPLEFVVNLSVGKQSVSVAPDVSGKEEVATEDDKKEIGTKLPKKPKVNSIEAAVVRTVEIEEELAKKAKEIAQVKPVPVQPTPVVQTAVKKEEVVEKTPPVVEKESAKEDGSGMRVEDWLLGSEDSGMQDTETKTVRMSRPSTVEVFVPEHEETIGQDDGQTDREKREEGSSRFGVKKAASSRDAAANLLKNFFKGGR
ncbi:MAG: FHA domain-containing protein [Planctomycetaceae bacterium]|nr:FHA domain-containing protein [Planctomycetaceae bacterium]